MVSFIRSLSAVMAGKNSVLAKGLSLVGRVLFAVLKKCFNKKQ